MSKAVFYRSIGPQLDAFDLDIGRVEFVARGTVTTPGTNIQYVWPHPSKPFLYVVASDGGPGFIPGKRHIAQAFRIDPATGALAPHGNAAPLPSRPIHCCVDSTGGYLLTAYNFPSNVTVHRLRPDGAVGEEIAQPKIDTGIFAHQVRTTPGNRTAILVTRGNHAEGGKPEDPGALKVYGFADGKLSDLASVAPGGGIGFGPRHLDFHPSEQWVFVSVERQSELHVYRLNGDGTLAHSPAFVRNTLVDPAHRGVPQMAGAIHVHPGGRFVYLTNRNSATTNIGGRDVFASGENTIAVFALDAKTGEPTLIQNAEAHTNHLRTFSIDPSGRLLIAAGIWAMAERDGGMLPAALVIYRIGDDGRLTFVRTYEVDTGRAMQFWSGIVALA